MNFNVIGLHPDNAIGHVLYLYDGKSAKDKISFLISNRPLDNLSSSEKPKQFATGKTIDINAGELLGLGIVGTYHNWVSEVAGTGNTYQVVVGLEDSVKAQSENLLSDGGIWHDQTKKKMLYQQALVQGYMPHKRRVTSAMVAQQINDKIKARKNYPEHCGLVLNIYSEEGELDFDKIRNEANLSAYDDVYVVWYKMPDLDYARVYLSTVPDAPYLDIKLARYPRSEKWEFNYDDARHYS